MYMYHITIEVNIVAVVRRWSEPDRRGEVDGGRSVLHETDGRQRLWNSSRHTRAGQQHKSYYIRRWGGKGGFIIYFKMCLLCSLSFWSDCHHWKGTWTLAVWYNTLFALCKNLNVKKLFTKMCKTVLAVGSYFLYQSPIFPPFSSFLNKTALISQLVGVSCCQVRKRTL